MKCYLNFKLNKKKKTKCKLINESWFLHGNIHKGFMHKNKCVCTVTWLLVVKQSMYPWPTDASSFSSQIIYETMTQTHLSHTLYILLDDSARSLTKINCHPQMRFPSLMAAQLCISEAGREREGLQPSDNIRSLWWDGPPT